MYEVLADGYHSPLTKTEIAALFRAGRLNRHQPCRQVEKTAWRTVDELFPLLKYDSSRDSYDQPTERQDSQTRKYALAIVISALAISVVSLGLVAALRREAHVSRDVATLTVIAKPLAQIAANPAPPVSAIENINGPSDLIRRENSSHQARIAQERLNAARKQEEQARVARLVQDRANARQRELELAKAAGRTERIPLDQFTIVRNVGGLDVPVKIHDRDITTIDVWTSYAGPRQMTKQKGITGSRMDETLIYQNRNAQLYYVWEISGKLNHCLLRVRDD